MKLSQTGRQFKENITSGFTPIDVDPSSESQLLSVLRCDWSPFIFANCDRHGDNFLQADCLLLDIDNTDGEKCTIASFEAIFQSTQYIISTSRNHQKVKMYGKGKTLESYPQDRFHVLFPLKKSITDQTIVVSALHALIKEYPFFDKAVSGPAQLVFANPQTIIKIHEGKEVEIPKSEPIEKPRQEQSFESWAQAMNEHEFLKEETNRAKL